MNRTLKEATVKRYYYDSHEQLRAHLDAFGTAYNFARRLKTLRGLAPCEYVCRISTEKTKTLQNKRAQDKSGLYTIAHRELAIPALAAILAPLSC